MARALAGAGWEVGVATTARRGLADASRSVARRHQVPAPGRDLSGFIRAIAEAIEEDGYELVFPGAGDSVLLALSLRRAALPATLPLPSHERVVQAVDKLTLTEAGRRAGLDPPRTVPADPQEIRGFGFPAVVKERLHADFAGSAHDRIEARIVQSQAEGATHAATIREAGGIPLLQDMAPGPLAAFCLVADRDCRIVARAQQVSGRTWPLGAGVSARARTVAVDASLEERVAALVRELEWFGLAEVQFALSEAGEPKLIDFNGRAYGSLALAVAAGVNLPAIWADVAVGGRATQSGAARPGVRYQWMEGDLRGALAEGNGRLRRLWDCLRYSRGAAHSVWSRGDPRPAGRYLRLRAAAALRKALPARVRWGETD
jgi:predicted ATP-grasp superfamily ATP-dependent carboligase